MTCEEYKDLIPVYLLGSLDPDEARSFLTHLSSGCPRCAGALAEAQAALSSLPLVLPPVAPPPRIREQLLARIAAQSASSGSAPPIQAHAHHRTIFPWTIGIAASLVAIGLGLWALQQHRDKLNLQNEIADLQNHLGAEQGEVRHLQTLLETQENRIRLLKSRPIQVALLQGTPANANAIGHVFFDAKNSSITIVAAGLVPLPKNKTYELWVIPTGKNPIPVGTFSVDSHGSGFMEAKVTQFAEANTAAVTAEPAGGSQTPTLPIRLVGEIEPIPH